MKNCIVIGTLVLLLFSCTSNTIFKKPDNLISEDMMADIMVDMEIAIIAEHKSNKYKKHNVDYMPLIYQKYGIDSTQFANSSFYYNTNIDVYKDILSKAKAKMQAKKTEIDQEIQVRDSIAFKKKEDDHPIITKDSLSK